MSNFVVSILPADDLVPGPRLNIKPVLPGMEISIIKVRQSDRLIFAKRHLYIETAPRLKDIYQNNDDQIQVSYPNPIEWDMDSTLSHCGLMTPYSIRDLGQHWVR